LIRILIADDQELVRTGFRVVLDPDVVLMDIRMPNLDGIEATRRIAATDGAPRVLILTTFDLDDYVYEALRAGASGFLLKDARAEELRLAVRTVASGDALLSPTITRRLIESYTRRPPPTARPAPLAELTPRELDVLRLLARGLSNADIARELVVGDATIKTHVARIFSKLDLHDRAQAVVLAYESGLVQPGGE
jgi:DNA-binding NarL/FixJ family response regulator